MNAIESIAARFATPPVHWIALIGLCAAYLQGGIVKATDFSGAIAEMEHFGLAPAAPMAVAVIILELGASVMILIGLLPMARSSCSRRIYADGDIDRAALLGFARGPRTVHGRERLL